MLAISFWFVKTYESRDKSTGVISQPLLSTKYLWYDTQIHIMCFGETVMLYMLRAANVNV